ncbi:MAG: hypothetical protein GXP42_14820 [Chloroflexi bacterium]|nr:hypothetical protein [Chloroflexota bacterium]
MRVKTALGILALGMMVAWLLTYPGPLTNARVSVSSKNTLGSTRSPSDVQDIFSEADLLVAENNLFWRHSVFGPPNISIYDIRNPLALTPIAEIPLPADDEGWMGLAVDGDRLYGLAMWWDQHLKSELIVYDISNMWDIKPIVSFGNWNREREPLQGRWPEKALDEITTQVFKVGDYLHIDDLIEAPISIFRVNEVERRLEYVAGYGAGSLLVASGSRAYTADQGEEEWSLGVAIYDISDPTQPVKMSDERLWEMTKDYFGLGYIVVNEPYLYRLDWDENEQPFLQIIDVTDPLQPRRLSLTLLEKKPYLDMKVVGNRLFILSGFPQQEGGGEGFNELNIFDVSDPKRPFLIQRYQILMNFFTQLVIISVSNHCVYMASRDFNGPHDIYVVCTSSSLKHKTYAPLQQRN